MLCRSDDEMPVNWQRRRFSSTERERICYNGEIVKRHADKFSLHINQTAKPWSYNLIIHNVNHNDAGEYTCTERAGLGPDSASANLTVTERDVGEHSIIFILPTATNRHGIISGSSSVAAATCCEAVN